ncbi:MAG: GMC family oxidoreductase [Gammaproteobacteria bacterium]
MKTFDLDDDSVVVVIGSGAGGGTLSAELTRRGVNVVCLEAGQPVTIEQNLPAMYGKLRWADVRTHEGDLSPDLPVMIMKAIGGTSVIWGGVALRRQPHEFLSRTTYGAVPGTSLVDWPLSYEDLAPYYDLAEQRMGVTGVQGHPTLPDHNNAELLKIGAARCGYKAISNGHLAINAAAHDGRAACRQMGFCAGGCVIGAKWSSLHAELPKAMASERFELRQQCHVAQIEHDPQGRASAVVYIDAQGQRQRQRARVVCVAGNGIETPRLLLLSASGRFPQGLANGAGQVGRHYMTDLLGRIIAIMPGRVDNYRGTTYTGLIADDMAPGQPRDFVGGFLYVSRGIHLPSFPNEANAAGWGAEYAQVMEQYPNMASAAYIGEDMPVADNRITLSDTVKDQYGLPAPHIAKRFHANDLALSDYALARGKKIFESVGATQVFTSQSRVVIHNLGTCRQSRDPADGVCDSFGRTHEVPNLYISDGSQFATSAAAPPTLTIVALAIRQAEHLAGRLAAGDV